MFQVRVGYVRVSSADQRSDRQLVGVEVEKVFSDAVSGRSVDRPGLAELLRFVREGDTVVVHSMDRLARNLRDLEGLVADLNGRGVGVEFVTEHLTFTGASTPLAMLQLQIMGAVAQFERALIRERQAEGIVAAKIRGAYTGRKPTLTPDQADQLRARHAAGEPVTALAREYGISRKTTYRYLERGKPAPGTIPASEPPWD